MNKSEILKKFRQKINDNKSILKLDTSKINNVVTKSEIKNTPLLKAYYIDTMGLDDKDDVIDIDIFKIKNGNITLYFGLSSDFIDKHNLNVVSTPLGDAVLID